MGVDKMDFVIDFKKPHVVKYSVDVAGYDYETDSYNPWVRQVMFNNLQECVDFKTKLIGLKWDMSGMGHGDVSYSFSRYEFGKSFDSTSGGYLFFGDFTIRRYVVQNETIEPEDVVALLRVEKINSLE